MTETSIDPDLIEVEAEFYFKQNDGTTSLDNIQMRLLRVMPQRGFDVLTQGNRVWEYISRQNTPDPTPWWKLKEKTGLANREEFISRHAIENLRQTRDDQPYRVTFRLIPVTWENRGYGL